MNHRRLLLSTVIVYAAVAGSILYRARPVEASSHPAPRWAAIGQASPQPGTIELPEGKGRDLTQKQCGTCHATNVWTNQHHTRDQWSSVIDNMVAKGMHASDDDLDTITDYLAVHFGPVTSTPPPSPSSAAPATPPPSR
jgi:cytochrome c5